MIELPAVLETSSSVAAVVVDMGWIDGEGSPDILILQISEVYDVYDIFTSDGNDEISNACW